ncbi:MAG: MaoC family dehydratase [Deltaproteobacteria bacterium]|nr:MaoC family dehydratase [Deltaproteobacteria bacterium]
MAEDLVVGARYELTVDVDDRLVRRYGEAVGDFNPVHFDDGFASRTRFGRRIAHGGLLFGVISRILGMHLPGPGTVFLGQTIEFKNPVFIPDRVTVSVELVELTPRSGARLRVLVARGDDVIAVGEAVVKLPSWGIVQPLSS